MPISINFGLGPKIESIQRELDSKLIFSSERLISLSKELYNIVDQIDQNSADKQQVISLIHRCHSLLVDTEVVSIAEEAQALAESGTAGTKKISAIQKKIKDILHNNALSPENRQLIFLANTYLRSIEERLNARNGIACQTSSKIISLMKEAKALEREEKIELAEQLYTIAGHLYQGQLNMALIMYRTLSEKQRAKLERDLPKVHKWLQEEVSPSTTLEVIQEIVFFAERLNNAQTKDTPPSKTEIDQIFQTVNEIASH